MILEIAEFRIRPGEQKAFEEALGRALRTITAKAKGATGYKLLHSLESHLNGTSCSFHGSRWKTIWSPYCRAPAHEEWRSIVRPFYAEPSTYEHFTVVTTFRH